MDNQKKTYEYEVMYDDCDEENEYGDDDETIDFNIDTYFEVDWVTTGENLKKLLLENTTKKMLEELFDRSDKTIDTYLKDPKALRMDDWLLIAKFLDMDITSVVVTKGKQQEIEVLEDYFWDKEEVERDTVVEKKTKGRPKVYDGPYKSAQEFKDKALYNEYLSRRLDRCTIRSLEVFLHYLPLVEPLDFWDFLIRANGNLYNESQRAYLYEQLEYMIESIPDSDAKAFAKTLEEFCLKKPNVMQTVDLVVKTKVEEEKYKEFRAYLKSENKSHEYRAYRDACREFYRKIKMLDKMELDNLE